MEEKMEAYGGGILDRASENLDSKEQTNESDIVIDGDDTNKGVVSILGNSGAIDTLILKKKLAETQSVIDSTTHSGQKLNEASEEMKRLHDLIGDSLTGIQELSKRKKPKGKKIKKIDQKIKGMSDKQRMVAGAAVGTVMLPVVGTVIGGAVGKYYHKVSHHIQRKEDIVDKLTNGGLEELQDQLTSALDNVNSQHEELLSTLGTFEDMLEEREDELGQINHVLETAELSEGEKSQLQNLHQQTSEQIILLKAKIENTEMSIDSYKIACVDLITTAPQALNHLAVATLGIQTGKTVEDVAENTQGLKELANLSVEASFAITARVAEQLKESVGGPVLKDSTITAIGKHLEQSRESKKLLGEKIEAKPSSALLALEKLTKE